MVNCVYYAILHADVTIKDFGPDIIHLYICLKGSICKRAMNIL